MQEFLFIIPENSSQKMASAPCPSAPMKCAPVASPVDKFAEIASLVANFASSANKWISLLLRS